MAKKKKKRKQITKSSLWTVICLVLLTLGALGIQLPTSYLEWLDELTPPTSSSIEKQEHPISHKNPGPEEKGAATFSTEELQEASKGWIKFKPLDQLGRATGADALLKYDMIGTGSSANAQIRPPGFISGTSPYFHSRGHLIGRQLGGSGDEEKNLVTLFQNPVNTPYMTKYENMIRDALENHETIRYRVTPIYNSEQLMCSAIKLEAKSISSKSSINFNVIILNER